MDRQLIKTIQGLGYDEKEANVYLVCLELDGASNNEIAKKTKLNRITNYEILKRLEKHGIVGSYKKRGGKHFMAVDPKVVIEQAKAKVKIAEQALPQLSALLNNSEKIPKMYYFEGLDGIKNIYNDSLQSKSDILTFTNPKELVGALGKYHEVYIQERQKKKIKVMALTPNDEFGLKAQNEGIGVSREVKLFDKNKYVVHNEVMIYDDKLAVFSGKYEVGVIIENQDIAGTFKNIWQMVWNNN